MKFKPLAKPPVGQSLQEEPGQSLWSRWFAELLNIVPLTRSYEASLNPASVPANSESTQTFTVTGLTTEDVVTVNKPSKTADLSVLDAFVSATGTLSLTFRNHSGGAIDPPAETYRIIATRL